jgi:ABC-type polysaccharide/polyol phosphate transport system ATPase subunit
MHEGSIAYKEGDRVRYKGSASGAQKSLIGVGMKLGLTKLVQTPFDCLLLDEVSADMDDEISMRCMLALSSFGQSVYVSHRQQDVADQVIMLER